MFQARLLSRLAALVAALSIDAAAQAIVFDDFNRPDSGNLGPNWVEQNGDFIIQANQGRGNVAFANDTWMSFTGFDQPYAQAKARVEFARSPGDSLFAAGLAVGLDPNTWGGVAVLVQDNDLNGLFDRIFFNAAINAGAWFNQPTPVFFDLPVQIDAGQLTVWIEDGGDRAVARVEDVNGNLLGTYSAAGILGSAFPPTGTKVGVWVRSRPRFDDFFGVQHRALDAYPAVLSLAAGGEQTLDVSLGTVHAGEGYLILGSLATATPGTPIGGGVLLPLAFDAVLAWTAANPNTPPYAGTFGVLDAHGHARARLALPPASLPALAGVTLHHCAIAYKQATGKPTAATNTAALTFGP